MVKMNEIYVSKEYCAIARDKEKHIFTLVVIAHRWLYELIYRVKEYELVWSESMLDKIE